jgi:hypothetical protein
MTTLTDAPCTFPPASAEELLEPLPADQRKAFLVQGYCAGIFSRREVAACFRRWPEMIGA